MYIYICLYSYLCIYIFSHIFTHVYLVPTFVYGSYLSAPHRAPPDICVVPIQIHVPYIDTCLAYVYIYVSYCIFLVLVYFSNLSK